MKFRNISAILIWSQDFRELAKWYKDTFGFEQIEEINHPDDTGVGFMVGNVYLWIGKHSKVKGKNKDPHRIMFNIQVDSVEEAYNHLVDKGVKIIAKPFKAPTFDKYFATFLDLDGNIVQVIGGK